MADMCQKRNKNTISTLMECFLEGIALLQYWYINQIKRCNKKSIFFYVYLPKPYWSTFFKEMFHKDTSFTYFLMEICL